MESNQIYSIESKVGEGLDLLQCQKSKNCIDQKRFFKRCFLPEPGAFVEVVGLAVVGKVAGQVRSQVFIPVQVQLLPLAD